MAKNFLTLLQKIKQCMLLQQNRNHYDMYCIYCRKLRQGRAQQTLFNLSLALMFSMLVFLVGIKQTHNYWGCLVVASCYTTSSWSPLCGCWWKQFSSTSLLSRFSVLISRASRWRRCYQHGVSVSSPLYLLLLLTNCFFYFFLYSHCVLQRVLLILLNTM